MLDRCMTPRGIDLTPVVCQLDGVSSSRASDICPALTDARLIFLGPRAGPVLAALGAIV